MPIANGVVEAVSKPKKTWTSKFGKEVGNVGVKLNNSNDWYNISFHPVDTPIPVSQGQEVSFMYEETERNGYVNRNIDKKTLEVTGGASAQTAGPATTTAAKAVGSMSARDDYWRKKEERDVFKDKRIEFQAARRDAITAAIGMVEQGIVKLPQKQGDKYDTFLSLVDAVTERFVTGVCAEATDQVEVEEDEDELPF